MTVMQLNPGETVVPLNGSLDELIHALATAADASQHATGETRPEFDRCINALLGAIRMRVSYVFAVHSG